MITTLLLVGFLPAVAIFIVSFAVRLYRQIQSPAPIALGCIIPKVCAVGSEEISRYNATDGVRPPVARHLRRQVRWKQFRVNWGFLSEQAWNTTLFQKAVRFEEMKIDPSKSALEYEQRDILVLELVGQAADMRWRLFHAQAAITCRIILGLSIDQQVSLDLLNQYRRLEQDILALAGMADDNIFHDMLMDRLGLQRGWGIIDGEANSPV